MNDKNKSLSIVWNCFTEHRALWTHPVNDQNVYQNNHRAIFYPYILFGMSVFFSVLRLLNVKSIKYIIHSKWKESTIHSLISGEAHSSVLTLFMDSFAYYCLD